MAPVFRIDTRPVAYHGVALLRSEYMSKPEPVPARPDIATQIYNQSLHTIMVAKVCQGNEPIDRVVKWAQNELAGLLRT